MGTCEGLEHFQCDRHFCKEERSIIPALLNSGTFYPSLLQSACYLCATALHCTCDTRSGGFPKSVPLVTDASQDAPPSFLLLYQQASQKQSSSSRLQSNPKLPVHTCAAENTSNSKLDVSAHILMLHVYLEMYSNFHFYQENTKLLTKTPMSLSCD